MSELTDDELLPCPMCGWQPDTAAYQFKTEIFCGNEGCGACRIVVDADDTPEHGLEAIARWNRRAAASTSTEGAGVKFEGIAKRKLDDLMARGWAIDGYAITKDGKHGFVTTGAFVGWWLPDQGMPSGLTPPASKVTTDEAEERG